MNETDSSSPSSALVGAGLRHPCAAKFVIVGQILCSCAGLAPLSRCPDRRCSGWVEKSILSPRVFLSPLISFPSPTILLRETCKKRLSPELPGFCRSGCIGVRPSVRCYCTRVGRNPFLWLLKTGYRATSAVKPPRACILRCQEKVFTLLQHNKLQTFISFFPLPFLQMLSTVAAGFPPQKKVGGGRENRMDVAGGGIGCGCGGRRRRGENNQQC